MIIFFDIYVVINVIRFLAFILLGFSIVFYMEEKNAKIVRKVSIIILLLINLVEMPILFYIGTSYESTILLVMLWSLTLITILFLDSNS